MRDFRGKARLRPFVLAARNASSRRDVVTELAYSQPSFSQFGEDLIISSLLSGRAQGRYVDVGAFDPFHYSNTYLLYRAGWSGINIEPVPHHLKALVRHRTRDTNLGIAITDRSGTVEINVAGTFSGVIDDNYAWDVGAERVTVESAPLRTVLAEHMEAGDALDLLSVDCEGADAMVLRTHDWDRWPPAVVVAELNGDGQVEEVLTKQGYSLHARAGLSGIFVAPVRAG